MPHIKSVTTEPAVDGAWTVTVDYNTGPDVVEECVSEDHARLVMQNWLREGFLEPNTKTFTCTYDYETRKTVHSRV